MLLSGANGDASCTVTIVSSPAGVPVIGSNNTFDYPIFSNVTLTCNVTSDEKLSLTVTSYKWNTEECYTNSNFNNGTPRCFPHGQTTQTVTGKEVTANASGTITCTVIINSTSYTSVPFTLRISGEHL